jgi:hypothetical protein
MADGIVKGVGEQLGQLGKQIAVDIATVPAKLTGLDKGTNESAGQGAGGKKQNTAQQTGGSKPAEPLKDPILELKQKDQVETQKNLAQARRLLELIMKPVEPQELTVREQMERDELEKKKKEIEEEKKKAAQVLPKTASKRPRGDLYGVKAKLFGGELGKNSKAQ